MIAPAHDHASVARAANLADIFRHHAQRRPRHPAIVARDRSWTYSQLDEAIDAAAQGLHDAGVRLGDMVGLALGDTPEHLAYLFGIARLGAVILPMDRHWTRSEKDRVAVHFGARIVLMEPDDEALAQAPVLRPARLEPAGVPPASRSTLFAHRFPPAPGDVDLPLVVSLSSGTTGRPKGPLLTHANFIHRFLIYFVSLTFNEHDRFACASPLYFSGSRGFSMCMLYAGGTLVLLAPPVPPEQLIQEISAYRCTAAFIVPTIIRRLIAAHDGDGHCLPGLRLLVSTGAALYPDDREAALRKVTPYLVNFYGSAEGGGVSVLTPAHPVEKAGSAGAVVFGTELRLVDEKLDEVPIGAVGRICYRSGATASEFFNDPEATATSFRDGWYFPGDLGYVDEDGFLFITGREKDMIIRGGVNIYPNEIEAALLLHPEVTEAAVVGVASRELGEEVVAFVTARGPVDAEQLRQLCSSQLARYKIPKAIHVLTEMPRTNVGKIDKQHLRASLAGSRP